MNWLARLKKTENTPDREPTKPTKAPFVGFVAPVDGDFQENEAPPSGDNQHTNKAANLPDCSEGVSQAQAAKLANMAVDGKGANSANLQSCQPVSQAQAAEMLVQNRPVNLPEVDIDDDQHAARVDLFTRRGLRVKDAEQLAEQVYRRALDLDDRRLCLECRHLSGKQCSSASYAGAGRVVEAIVRLPQRCPAFEGVL